MAVIWTLLIALVISAWRIKKRLFAKGEAVLWALFILNVVLVQLQLFVELKRFKVDFRYLSPAFVLLWPVCLWPFSRLWEKYKNLQYLFIVIFIVAFSVNMFRVLKHNFGMGNRARKTLVADWAAKLIKKDWDGPKKDDKLHWSIKEYNTKARPVINCQSSYRRIAYLTGGRIYFPEVGGKNKGDYYLIENDKPPANSRLVGEYLFKKRKFYLYRVKVN